MISPLGVYPQNHDICLAINNQLSCNCAINKTILYALGLNMVKYGKIVYKVP